MFFFTILGVFPNVAFSQVSPVSLAEYRFEEESWDGTEGEILDSSGNGYHARVNRNSILESISPALSSNLGTCSYASQSGGSIQVTGLPLDTSTIGVKTTITFWMNWDGTENTMPIGWDSHDIWMVDGYLGFNTGNSDLYGISSAGLANGWHHVAVEFTNGNVTSNRIHIDGAEQVLNQLRNNRPNNNLAFVDSELRIGGWSNDSNYNFHGLMDEVRVYESALTTTQIETIMAERHYCSVTPIAEYRLDELSYSDVENEVVDSMGGFDGRAKSAQPLDGKVCNAVDLRTSGTADYLTLDEDILTGQTDFTVSVWAKTSKQTNQSILSGAGASNNELLMWFVDKDTFSPFLKDRSNGNVSVTSIADDNWHHLVWTREGNQSCIYRDKVFEGCVTQSSTTLDIQSLILGQEQDSVGGRFSSSQAYDGLLDELLVYHKALSQREITSLYNNQNAGLNYDGSARTCPIQPVALAEYRFEEERWNDTAGEILDNTGNGYHGQVINNATPETTSPALSGNPGTCGYASQNDGSIQVTGLPLDTSTIGVKTTVTFWMNWDGTDNVMPIGWNLHDIWLRNGSIGFNTWNTDIFGTSSTGLANGWHHIAVEFTNGSVTDNRMYIDGEEKVLTQQFGSTNTDRAFVNSQMRVGGVSNSTEFNFHGLLDEFRVYEGTLTINQIITIMNERHECVTFAPDHFEIQHDGQGFTCKAETVTIKACANADCDVLYDQETSILLSPSGWASDDALVFTGELTTTLSVTDESTISMAKTSASPDADLYCFNGDTETCDIAFSNDGFEIYGENIGDSVPDQLAAKDFLNVNLRAVRSNNNVCEALLVGTQEINLTYDCDSPDQCLTPLNDISLDGNGTGESTGTIEVEFDDQGVASLALLNYPDAGRIKLRVEADIEGVTFDSSDFESVDIYPSYLALSVEEIKLIYGDPDINEQNNYVAGENFSFIVGAYGVNDQLLPNYQAENPQLKVIRLTPSSIGENGNFKYSELSSRVSNGLFSDVTDISSSGGEDHFGAGEYRFNGAYYSEVGRIEVDLKDADYLGNIVESDGTLTLGDFYPAYFQVALTDTPTLADTCNSTFSYLGQNINFETSPVFTITAYNALDTKTLNYSDAYWNYLPNESTLETNLSFVDSSTYADVGSNSASVIDPGNAPVIGSNNNYDGSGTVTINNAYFRYNKVDPDDNSVFAPVSPFAAKISLTFASDFYTSIFVGQNGDEDTICYQVSYADNTCLGWDIENVSGTEIRYGRFTLESTYGPETEPLIVPIKTEYFNADQWLLNTDDSYCTNIDFTEEDNEIQLSDTSFADSFNNVTSSGVLVEGVAVDDQFILDAPNTSGELNIWLDPTNVNLIWPDYLNYDWNGDGFINTDDFPEATVSFGLFRGNDRIIHWREVFN